MTLLTNERPYRGRFAPSPSGFLHFGSLIAALASYLDAKANNGKWLVRIEDIDPPREMAGASDEILKTLESYGLFWDESVLYQSSRSASYNELLASLLEQHKAYYCRCTRAQIKARGGIYDGHCKHLDMPASESAIRLINEAQIDHFDDRIQGQVQCNAALAAEDFTIHRKDGLYAYQLAVVADDIHQNITHVVRGCDLLEPTCRQMSFYQQLSQPFVHYAHVPLAVTDEGYKLSKQNKAPAIDNLTPQPSIIAALSFLGQQPPKELADASVEELIAWATNHWDIKLVPKTSEIALT